MWQTQVQREKTLWFYFLPTQPARQGWGEGPGFTDHADPSVLNLVSSEGAGSTGTPFTRPEPRQLEFGGGEANPRNSLNVLIAQLN